MGASNPDPQVVPVRVLGIFAMLRAWLLRSLDLPTGHARFDGRRVFRAFVHCGTLYYFRPFTPRLFKMVEHAGPWSTSEMWMGLHNYGGNGRVGSWLRLDRECLFLHEGMHAVFDAAHTDAGIMAPGFIQRNRTTTWDEIEEAWHAIGTQGTLFRFGRL